MYELIDVFRERCPRAKRYTWRVKKPVVETSPARFLFGVKFSE